MEEMMWIQRKINERKNNDVRPKLLRSIYAQEKMGMKKFQTKTFTVSLGDSMIGYFYFLLYTFLCLLDFLQ